MSSPASRLALLVPLLALLAAAQQNGTRVCCQAGQACWPTAAEIAALEAALDPEAVRSIYWNGAGTPYPLAFPDDQPQPLYGAGQSMQALYAQNVSAGDSNCMASGTTRTAYCKLSSRNNPMNGWTPTWIAWPVTATHVQTLVQFANDHSLCVCIAGTGHDFVNRHSCMPASSGGSGGGSLLIRTALFKNISWDLEDAAGFGVPAGTVTVGAGVVFHELHAASHDQNRAIASGWSPTVGVAGWSLGGGHGPVCPAFGLGADQIVQVTLVAADASLVTANANGTTTVHPNGTVGFSPSTDLLWAVRGGGGGNWGVIVSFTLKTHPIPAGGFTFATATWSGERCSSAGIEASNNLVTAYLAWALTLNSSWGGLAFVQGVRNAFGCQAYWYLYTQYVYQGGQDEAFNQTWSALGALSPGVTSTANTYSSIWGFFNSTAAEDIYTTDYLDPSETSLGGLPSVLVSRETVASGAVGALIHARLDDCLSSALCWRQELYHDITGQSGSPQDPFTAVSPGMRTSVFHFLSYGWTSDVVLNQYYPLGNHSYFSESAYLMSDWQDRYWGADNYARLSGIKNATDPAGLFWCHHCVNDYTVDPDYSSSGVRGAATAAPVVLAVAAVVAVLVAFA